MGELLVHGLSRDLWSVMGAAQAPFHDMWLSAKARLAVLLATGREASGIAVETFHGCVTLTGTVGAARISADAALAVRELAGVRSVSNLLRVTPAHAAPQRYSDAEIRRAVETRLRANQFLQRSRIYVQTVYDGVVRLAGTASGPQADALAFEEAASVPGVRRVASETIIEPPTAARTVADAA